MQWTTGEQKKKWKIKENDKLKKYHVATSVSPMQRYTVEMRRLGSARGTQEESGHSIAKQRLAAQFLIYQ